MKVYSELLEYLEIWINLTESVSLDTGSWRLVINVGS